MNNPVKYWLQRQRERQRFEQQAKQQRQAVRYSLSSQDDLKNAMTTYAIMSPMFTSIGESCDSSGSSTDSGGLFD
jgi:hypothetical protein